MGYFVTGPKVWKQRFGPRPKARRYVVTEAASSNSRTPFAHPEGFIEAFANVFLAAAQAIGDQIEANPAPDGGYDHPTFDDRVAGNGFIEACVESSQNNAAWTKLDI